MPPVSPSGKTIGIIAGTVAGLVVLGVVGYFGYRTLFPPDSSSRVASSDVPASTAPAPSPPKEVVTAPPSPTQDAVSVNRRHQDAASVKSMPAMSPDSPAKSAAKDSAATVPASPTGVPGTLAPKMDSSTAPPAKATNPPVPAGSPAMTAETPGALAQAKNPGQPPERWKQMREAMARCAGDNFFKRVACEQGVGQQYCEGYWGKVPQCPSGPPPVKGQ
jgi:hypothetical protein